MDNNSQQPSNQNTAPGGLSAVPAIPDYLINRNMSSNNKPKFSINKNVIGLIIVAILVVSIPLVLNLLKNQQILKSRASFDSNMAIQFQGENVTCDTTTGSCSTKTRDVTIQLTSPFGSSQPSNELLDGATSAEATESATEDTGDQQ